jgi:soluble lytic murein transglycosylase-like protein
MQEKYRHIVAATIRSSSAMTEEILYAVMWVESKGKPSAVSSKGAQGVMQINAITQRELGLKPGEAFIPKKAIPKAAEYLETNYETFGDWPSALLAYGIGPGNARSYLRKKKDPSKHPYVKKVLSAQSLM